MLLLFETAAGFALFKVVKEDKIEKAEVSVFCVPAAMARERLFAPPLFAHTRPQRHCKAHDLALVRVLNLPSRPPHRAQDLYKDFETLDAAQKVCVGGAKSQWAQNLARKQRVVACTPHNVC